MRPSLAQRCLWPWSLVAVVGILAIGVFLTSGLHAPMRPSPERAQDQDVSGSTPKDRGRHAQNSGVASSPGVYVTAETDLPGGELSGSVVASDTGGPIQGARLTFATQGTLHDVTTATTGQFLFRPRSPGEYRLIEVSARGFTSKRNAWREAPSRFIMSAGRRVDGMRIRLSPATLCSGFVVFEDGGPAPGATVRILRPDLMGAALAVEATHTTSDELGAFFVVCEPNGVVEATLGGLPAAQSELDPAIAAIVVLRETRALFINGRVIDGDGLPVAGERVRALKWEEEGAGDDGGDSVWEKEAWSREKGDFAVGPLPHGKYLVEAISEMGFPEAWAEGVEAGTSDVTLRLNGAGQIHLGVSRGDAGEPVSLFTVTMDSLSQDAKLSEAFVEGTPLTVLTSDGWVTIAGIPPGLYDVEVKADGFNSGRASEVTVRPGETTHVKVVLDARRPYRGQVRDAHSRAPVKGARVYVYDNRPREEARAPKVATTNERGEFSIEGSESETTMFVAADGFRSWRQPLEVAGSASMLVELTKLVDAGADVEYGGVGLALKSSGPLVITRVFPASPAERAGVLPGDVLLGVDNEVPVTVFSGVELIRGPVGSPVRLTLRRGDGGIADVVLWRERLLEQRGIEAAEEGMPR